MTELNITCPHCGQIITLIVNETADKLAVRSFDIYDNSETIRFLKLHGYEFGTNSEEGGDNDGR